MRPGAESSRHGARAGVTGTATLPLPMATLAPRSGAQASRWRAFRRQAGEGSGVAVGEPRAQRRRPGGEALEARGCGNSAWVPGRAAPSNPGLDSSAIDYL